MAWQLIYTSAPRLLEAGRTGFGTVARHRAVSGFLANAVERFSQFARLPGHDPRRIVYCHRIVTVGNNAYHILSCLRDAGSDYTGRTNHMAQHVIAEAREVLPLAAAGVTPADVLLAMPWRQAWTDKPRFLDPAEEIDLSTLGTRQTNAWERVTGSQQNSRLPLTSAAQRGCYLIIPSGVDARELFRESLCEAKDQAWQMTFTTSLESSDDLADFRWIGLAPDSPLRPQAESSARPVFDLLRPVELPALQTAVGASAETGHAISRATTEAAPFHSHVPTAVSEPPARPDERHATHQDMTQAQVLPDADFLHKPSGKNVAVRLLMAVVLLAAGAVAVLFHQLRHHQQNQEEARLEKWIDDVWSKYHLKLDDTRRWLKLEASRSAAAEGLIASHEGCLKQIRQSLQQPGASPGVTTPDRTQDDFNAMLNAHADWLKKHNAARVPPNWEIQRPSDAKLMLERWEVENQAWQVFASHFTQAPAMDDSNRRLLVRCAFDALKSGTRPAGTAEEWRKLLTSLGEPKVPAWLQDWSKLESAGNTNPAAGLSVMMARLAQQHDAPAWFLALLREMKQADAAPAAKAGSENMKVPEPIQTARPSAANPDSCDALHPIFVLTVHDGELPGSALARLPELPVEPVMTLQFGSLTSRAGDLGAMWRLLGSAYRMAVNSNDKISFEAGRISHLPEIKEGCRLVAFNEDGSRVLFDLRVVTKDSQVLELLTFDKLPELQCTTAENTARLDGIGRIIGRLHWTDVPAPQFQLRFEGKEGTAAEQRLYAVRTGSDDEPAVMLPGTAADGSVLEIRRLLFSEAELNQGIKKDQEFIRNLNPRMAGRDRKEADLRAAIAEKELRLATVADQLKALQTKAGPVGSPPAGTYTLLEMTGPVRSICKVSITRSSKAPASGKSTP